MQIKTLVMCTLLLFTNHTFYGFSFFAPRTQVTPISIMIEPSGDAKHAGRKIDDSFERGITLQCAEKIKTLLEEKYGAAVRVVLTRFPRETLQPLQNALFANRLNVVLYMGIHFYQETEQRPKLNIYQFSYGDTVRTNNAELVLYPYDKAYLLNNATTSQWALLVKQTIERTPHTWFELQGVFKIPFKPLIGISSPAIAFEIGLQAKDDWTKYSDVIAASVDPIIKVLMS